MADQELKVEECKYTFENKFLEVVPPYKYKRLQAKGALLTFSDLHELEQARARGLVKQMNEFAARVRSITTFAAEHRKARENNE